MNKNSIFRLILSSLFLLQCNNLMTSYDFNLLDFKNKADVEEVKKICDNVLWLGNLDSNGKSDWGMTFKIIVCRLKGSKEIAEVVCLSFANLYKDERATVLNLFSDFTKSPNLSNILKYVEKIASRNGIKKLEILL